MVSKKGTVVCIVGLGYVGLPLAVEFAKKGVRVVGFDVDDKKVKELRKGRDIMGEYGKGDIKSPSITYTSNAADIGKANFMIISVPTPVTKKNKPDMRFLKSASKTVGKNIKKGNIVVYESTVYPGATEEVCVPILEKSSKLKCGRDFKVGYSPERINPGDRKHTVTKIVKVVSGIDKRTTDDIAKVYGWIVKAGTYKAKDIKTAEAAKVIENIQRDLNIALMNELSLIFDKMGINTLDVVKAAGTKWNFHTYQPGLVGGHCIPVDPYYLVHKAKKLGYNPKVILSGRSINDSMASYVARKTVQLLKDSKKKVKGARVLLMGLTFKENVADLRTTPAKAIILGLKRQGVKVIGYDPLVEPDVARRYFKITALKDFKAGKFDAVIVSVVHDEFKKLSLEDLQKTMRGKPVLMDVKGFFKPKEAHKLGFSYKQL